MLSDGSLACTTCHVVVQRFDSLNELCHNLQKEEDMPGQSLGLGNESRLSCQCIVVKI